MTESQYNNLLINDETDVVIIKEGLLRKRSGRMHQWSSRYFLLYQYNFKGRQGQGCRLSYKIKNDNSIPYKGSFDLMPGCIVTEVAEESSLGYKSNKSGGPRPKKMFTFWIVWPTDKNAKPFDFPILKDSSSSVIAESGSISQDVEEERKEKDLKQIVENEVNNHKLQKTLVEEQIERHHAHDNNVSAGVKFAAVALGGVVIGALTAGIGLVPYITVVGITAVATGGAAVTLWKRPNDSRLIIACESMLEAMDWRSAIEGQILRLEERQKPSLPWLTTYFYYLSLNIHQ